MDDDEIPRRREVIPDDDDITPRLSVRWCVDHKRLYATDDGCDECRPKRKVKK